MVVRKDSISNIYNKSHSTRQQSAGFKIFLMVNVPTLSKYVPTLSKFWQAKPILEEINTLRGRICGKMKLIPLLVA